MKQSLILLIFLGVCFGSKAQKNKKKQSLDNSLSYENVLKKYTNSIKYLDYATSINAVHELLILRPEEKMYFDTLLYLYSSNDQFESAILLAGEMEDKGIESQKSLEVLALAYQRAGMDKKALEYYEELITISKELYYYYQIANIQFNLSRIKECSETIELIISSENAIKETVKIDYQKGQSQDVPFAAAAYNIKGVMALNVQLDDKAKENFEKAIQIDEDFTLAIKNLEYLNNK